ncbi:hypothetical protein DLAC_00169 [Tieghemostelium lacteum]|uniref:Integral membrane bound transporter domain-containing protein n=1 Tax=Tieghemostelium lacteum TaxID=361077 RepID=A0A152A9G6_TIELA|nr:hypothetical protein DLAC_00169 [Tieghemostelium lacteum]|eukprot:KYR02707.1 hypothetical protein DLAC_00169 [Tieghemostelium lacteum]
MFLEYFLLVYYIRPVTRSPIIFLKSSFSSVCTFLIVFVSCLLCQPYFSSQLFIRTTKKILHRSHKSLSIIQRLTEIRLIKEERENKMNTPVLRDIHRRLKSSLVQLPSLASIQRVEVQFSESLFNQYKERFKKTTFKISTSLNRLDTYADESVLEFWNGDLTSQFPALIKLLETNHRKLISLQLSIIKEEKRVNFLVQLLPLLHLLIQESCNIFIIMENQLSGYYRYIGFVQDPDLSSIQEHLQSNLPEKEEPRTLEYSQFKIFHYFQNIQLIIEDIDKELSSIQFESIPDLEAYKLHYFLEGMIRFTRNQKTLSSIIYKISCITYTQRKYIYLLEMVKNTYYLIKKKTHQFQQNTNNNNGSNSENEYPKELEPKFSTSEKLKIIFGYLLFERILCDWRFSLRYSMGIAAFSIAYYEIITHSDFILFQNGSWVIVTLIFVMAPSAGASGFFSVLRLSGTLLGASCAYVVAVLFSLPSAAVAESFIYIGGTMVLSFSIYFLTKSKPIHNYLNFFILTYSTVTTPEYNNSKADIITALLRGYHIICGIFIIFIMSYLIFPYYDYKVLDGNLIEITCHSMSVFRKILLKNVIGSSQDPIEYQDQISNEFENQRSEIAKQIHLLFYSRFELIFSKQSKLRFAQYKHLYHQVQQLFTNLVGLECIFHDSNVLSFDTEYQKNIQLLLWEIESISSNLHDLIGHYKHQHRIYCMYSHRCNQILKAITKCYCRNNRIQGEVLYAIRSFIETLNQIRETLCTLTNCVKLNRSSELFQLPTINILPTKDHLSPHDTNLEIPIEISK